MAWDLESMGGGGITGLFIGVLTALGLKGKVDKLDEKKQDIKTCDALHKGIDEKFIIMTDIQREIRDRLNELNDYLRNKG